MRTPTERQRRLKKYRTMTTEERREFVKRMHDTTNSWQECWEEHMSSILAHYAHAREKHPYFCDWVKPDAARPEQKKRVATVLAACRDRIANGIKHGRLGWDDILDCEMWEVFEALVNGDKEQAVEELYDVAAVILRTIDVLEGRQKLGKPEEKGETK